MRVLWSTWSGPDPALRQVFAADQPAALATAVVGGVEVVVTLTEGHEDFDCNLGDLHHQRCPEPGMRIWERATGALLRTVPEVGSSALLVTVVVDGRPLAVVREWARPPTVVDLETGRGLGTLPGHDSALDVQDMTAVMLADGPAVVTVGWDGFLRVTALRSGRTTSVDTGERLNAVAVVHVAGRPVAATGRDAVTLWDLVDGTRAGALRLSSDGGVPAAIVSWSGSSMIAVLDFDGVITVGDAGAGGRRLLGERLALRPWSIAALVAADGRPLLGMADGETVNLWEVRAEVSVGAPLIGPVSHARMLSGGPGVLLVGSEADDAISMWDLGGEGRPGVGTGHPSDIRCLAVTPDGEVVAGGGDGVLSVWRLADGVRGPDLGSLPGKVSAVAAVQTCVLAAGGDLRSLFRWVDGDSAPAVTLDDGEDVDIAVPFELDGEPAVLTAGCHGQIRLTQVRTGLHLGTIVNRHPPRGVAVGLLDGRPTAAIGGMFGPMTVCDLVARTEKGVNVEIGEAVRGWIGAGPAVVTVRGSLVRMHNLRTGEVSPVEPGQDVPVAALAAADGLIAIARVDTTVSVVDATTGQGLGRLTLPCPAQALAWAPHGRLVLACRRDLYCAEVDRLTPPGIGGAPAG
ncbi:WD40 repeat domain-containing protein [Actinoplanes palleronii]|uniref:WD40 repeat protein n=1 Tax=Actinoplanes palleronii TaxID=113570 RepID=A0ABQ4BNX9_9ACTN|nr:hypothetical protein [Actinoplanes palleronii]GIE72380.1 hypothetical protein Apa02nite_084880 [Actinoplanes palleronii]